MSVFLHGANTRGGLERTTAEDIAAVIAKYTEVRTFFELDA